MCNCYDSAVANLIGLPLFLLVNGCAVGFVAAFTLWLFEKMILREDEKK